MMVEFDCGEIPICETTENGRIVGVITDRDIACRAVAEGMDVNTTQVSACMTAPAITADPSMTLEQCMQLMEKNMIRRLPVMDETGCVCGMLSQADIAEKADSQTIGEVVREVSKPTDHASRVSKESSTR
jgi:CBS domain-containing protein